MSGDLVPTWVIGNIDLTEYPFSVDRDNAVDVGDPEMVVESVASQLADGDIERTVRYGNRTYVLPIYIEGPTLADVADAEALLRAELLRAELRRTGLLLTHNPGDTWAVASVYEVQTARMTPSRDDTHESHLIRKWTLTLTCAPFARSLNMVTVDALEAGSTTTTFDTCDSATGWTATTAGMPAVASTAWEAGSVGVAELDDLVPASPETWTLTRTGSVDFTSTPFLKVEVRTIATDVGSKMNVKAYASATEDPGARLTLMSAKRIPGTAYFEVVYDLTGHGSVPALTFSHTSYRGQPWQGIFIRNLARTDVPPNITARQVTRVVDVLGTERTSASLAVSSANGTSNLGMTIVHTSPEDGSGYSPPLRRWRVSGGTVTTDAATMSGGREPIALANPFIADIPNNALPEGGYLLAARLRVTSISTAVINWATDTQIDGASEGYVTDFESVDFPAANAWFFVPIAVLTLPSVRSYSGNVRVLLSSETAELDEAWLLRVDDDCALSVVHNAVKPRLWLDSPDLDSSVPRIWIGDNADRSDASHPGANLYTHGNHTFTPDRVRVFTATSGTEYPSVKLTYYPRWHSNAAE